MDMKKLFSSLLLAVVATTAFAQSDDFGLWTSLGAEKDFGKKWTVSLGTEARFEDNVSKVSRMGFDFGVTYKPYKFLRVGVGYAFMRDRYPYELKVNYSTKENEDETGTITTEDYENGYNYDGSFRRDKNRFFFQVTGRHKLGRFTFSLRERLQYTNLATAEYSRTRYRKFKNGIALELTPDEAEIYDITDETVYTLGTDGNITEGYVEDAVNYFCEYPTLYNGEYYYSPETVTLTKSSKNRLYLRSRLQVSYNIKGLPLEPYASFEVSNNLREGFALEKRRWTVGMEYTINKRHTFGLSYVYSNGTDDDDEGNLHAVSVGYTIHL